MPYYCNNWMISKRQINKIKFLSAPSRTKSTYPCLLNKRIEKQKLPPATPQPIESQAFWPRSWLMGNCEFRIERKETDWCSVKKRSRAKYCVWKWKVSWQINFCFVYLYFIYIHSQRSKVHACRALNRQEERERLCSFPVISHLGKLSCVRRWHLVLPRKWIPGVQDTCRGLKQAANIAPKNLVSKLFRPTVLQHSVLFKHACVPNNNTVVKFRFYFLPNSSRRSLRYGNLCGVTFIM